MNSFYEHHRDSIHWHYRCFDRILLNGLIQPFQQPERVVGFFNTYRQLYPVTRYTLRDIADQFQRWVTERAEKRSIPIVEAPKGRRDEFVDPYFERAKPDAIVAILKAREPARIMIAIGDRVANRWHLQFAQRWVIQYNFDINDRNWGRMFVRVCPYLPFSARICLNQHHWLANRMGEKGIGFKQTANAFLKCAVPDRLQELANSLTPRDLVTCGQKWLTYLTPFFTTREREHAGCQHRLFFSQVEYCDNLIFHRRAALDNLGQRLLDANRTIGQPNKITVIFGRKVTKQYRGKLQTEIEDMNLPNPVVRSHFATASSSNTFAIISSCGPRPRATTSTTTASTKPSKISLSSKNLSRRSTIITSTSSRTFWKPLSIAASCESSPSQPSHRPESAFRASSLIILGNSH